MFCPRCGTSQSDELKFCKACGANLNAVRQVVDARDVPQKLDWNKTWVADMFMSDEEAQRRQEELDRRRGITPATRRYQEIKAGVITSSVGFAIMIFLWIFMGGIIQSGKVSSAAAEILSHLWVAGIIPLLVGAALIINGYFVSRKIVELAGKTDQFGPGLPGSESQQRGLHAADTNEFLSSKFSVTEGTTKHLDHSS
jgi:hypothetical protein